jgi:hypothetical protein
MSTSHNRYRNAHGKLAVALRVNGITHELSLDPRVSLLDALRDHVGLTGTKRAATRARAARVPCWSTANVSTPVSRSPCSIAADRS